MVADLGTATRAESSETNGRLAPARACWPAGRIQSVKEVAVQMCEIVLATDEHRARRNVLGGAAEKAIPAMAHRFDESWGQTVVAKRRAHLGDARSHHARSDGDSRPDGTQELVSGDQTPRPLGEMAQHGQRLRAQRALLLAAPQTPVGEVDPKFPERHDASDSHAIVCPQVPSYWRWR